MAKPGKQARKTRPVAAADVVRVYTLEVALAGGSPPTAAGAEPGVTRTFQVRGDQTLADLHRAVAAAFGRTGDYSYEFQFEGGPLHPEGRRYVLPPEFDLDVEAGNPAAGRVTDTPLDALGLEVGHAFTYWPDYGDDWWHPVKVRRVASRVPGGKYPKLTGRKGDSPYQAGDNSRRPPGKGDALLGPEETADTACLVGEVHLSKGEYPKAVEAFSRAIASRPTADAYQGRAQAYRALAAADVRAARRLRPG